MPEEEQPAATAGGSPSDSLAAVKKLREEGNDKFKAKELDAAKECYEKARDISEKALKGLSGDAATDLKAVRQPTLLNLALCYLQSVPCQAQPALLLCEEVLEDDPDNVKATFRKAKALIELDEMKEAEWELVRACKLSPKDADIRRTLENVRKRVRDSKAKQKETYAGLFERGPGFASDQRTSAAPKGSVSQEDIDDMYFHSGEENPYEASENPAEEARRLQDEGKLADATQAWEAAVLQTSLKKDWPTHFGYLLNFGCHFMDINLDRLALRCFKKILEPAVDADDLTENQEMPPPAPPVVKRNALLLKAVAGLNESSSEVEKTLELWLQEATQATANSKDVLDASQWPLDARISQWQDACEARFAADAAVACGLLHLLNSGASPVELDFANALRAPEDEESCFGSKSRLHVKWNMLGAVLANRKEYEKAMDAYEQALKLRPHYPRALINRGIAQTCQGKRLESAASYAIALRLLPDWAAQEVWATIDQVVGEHGSVELTEAVKERNLVKVQEILKLDQGRDNTAKAEPVADVLARMNLAK